MTKKIVFFDVDGTLLDEKTGTIPQRTITALERLRQKGHLAFINTGRPFSHINPAVKRLDFDGYVCACGAYIRHGSEVLFYKTLTPELCRRIVTLVRRCRLMVTYESLDGVYFDLTRPLGSPELRHRRQFAELGFNVDRSIDAPGFVFDKFVVWATADSDVQRFHQEATQDFEYIDRGSGLFELSPKGCSKATGIQLILERLQLPLASSYAIGDSPNDLTMLNYVPNSIAMGNSPPSLYDKVSFVTKNIDDNGIEHALTHFGLI